MTEKQWSLLLDVINGKTINPLPVGFIIDSPWLPGWAGISIMDYYLQRKDVARREPESDKNISGCDVSTGLLVRIRNVHRAFRFRLEMLVETGRISVRTFQLSKAPVT